MKEKQILKKIHEGDADAYKYLFSEYYSWLCNYIFKLCGNRSLAEDLVQEVFIHLWEKRTQLTIKSSLKNYLFRSCHNQFLQYVRKEKVRNDFLNSIRWDVLLESYTEESHELREMQLKKLNTLISELPPRCKEVFVKSKFEKKKYKEIAVDLGISIKTVEAQMSKALHYLREHASMLLL